MFDIGHQYHSTSVPQPYYFHVTATLQTIANDTAAKYSTYPALCRYKGHRQKRLLCVFLFQIKEHSVYASQLSGENKPDIQLRKYQSSDMTTSHFISVHTHTILSFGSELLLYFGTFICLLK